MNGLIETIRRVRADYAATHGPSDWRLEILGILVTLIALWVLSVGFLLVFET